MTIIDIHRQARKWWHAIKITKGNALTFKELKIDFDKQNVEFNSDWQKKGFFFTESKELTVLLQNYREKYPWVNFTRSSTYNVIKMNVKSHVRGRLEHLKRSEQAANNLRKPSTLNSLAFKKFKIAKIYANTTLVDICKNTVFDKNSVNEEWHDDLIDQILIVQQDLDKQHTCLENMENSLKVLENMGSSWTKTIHNFAELHPIKFPTEFSIEFVDIVAFLLL